MHLARTVYEGANHTHISELLSEREGLDMGRTTLRSILVRPGSAARGTGTGCAANACPGREYWSSWCQRRTG